jgi:hypothetical protein
VPETCAVKRSTGLECPTCHLGRSIVALAHGDVDASRRHHRGGIWLMALVAIQFPLRVALAIARPRGERWLLDLAVTLAVLTAVTAVVVYGWV